MLKSFSSKQTINLAFMTGGPALIGASMGIPLGLSSILHRAFTLPAIIIGLSFLMISTLYIFSAMAHIAPAPIKVITETQKALLIAGTAMFGFALPLLFLVSTSSSGIIQAILGPLAIFVGLSLGLRSLYLNLFAGFAHYKALPIFLFWSFICMGIGVQLMDSTNCL